MADGTNAHRISVSVQDKTIEGWIDYDISSSMLTPADGFSLTRAFTLDAWKLCRKDARVKIAIDGVVQVDGFIDVRSKSAADGTMRIEGRCKVGRLVQTSIATTTGYDGMTLVDAVKKLAAPEFTTVVLSDARNRSVRRGKGGRAPAQGEPAIFNVKGKLNSERAGKLDPGEMRWNVIEQLCSSVGLACWTSADGRELVIGKPNYKQEIQFFLRHSRTRGSNVVDMQLTESVRDGYAMIETHGSGGGGDEAYGDGVISHEGNAFDGPNPDGTGFDFTWPKRLLKTQRAVASNAEAGRAAVKEMLRRRFDRAQLVVEAPLHGQRFRSDIITLFAPNTLARVIDDDLGSDQTWLIYEVKFKGSRKTGERTTLKLVPRGTVFIP